MILSDQKPLVDIAVLKLDSDDEEISFTRPKGKRQGSPARTIEVAIEGKPHSPYSTGFYV